MKRGDLIFLACFAAAGLALAWPDSRDQLRELSMTGRYRFGFLSFAVMGTVGQSLAARFSDGRYPAPSALAASVLMWGLYGTAMALLIWLVNGGVVMLQTTGLLPGGGLSYHSNIFVAIASSMYFTQPLFTSVFLNFGAVHPLTAVLRLSLTAAEMRRAEGRCPGLARAASAVDWADFIRREIHAIPMFRIPALTVVFMLPQDMWLMTAALATGLLTVLEGLVLKPQTTPEAGDENRK